MSCMHYHSMIKMKNLHIASLCITELFRLRENIHCDVITLKAKFSFVFYKYVVTLAGQGHRNQYLHIPEREDYYSFANSKI